MDWHVFVVFGAFFCACLLSTTQGTPLIFDTKIREKRSPQDNGLLFQTSGTFNLGGLNLPQVASNVRKHLHDLVDTVTNPLNIEAVVQVEPMNTNYQYDYTDQYQMVDQQYQNIPQGNSFEESPYGPPERQPSREYHPHERPPRDPPHRHHPRGPPHGHPPRGPPHGHPPEGPPHGHPPGGPPHGHPPGGPPHGHPPGGPPYGYPPGGPPPPPPPYEEGPPSFPPRPPFSPPPQGTTPSSEKPIYEDVSEETAVRPGFDQQPNYPGKGKPDVNVDLSQTTTSTNLDEKSTSGERPSNVSGYIEDNFPVILLNENEIR